MKKLLMVLALLSLLGALGACAGGGGGSSSPAASGSSSSSTPFQTASGTGTAVLDWDAPTTNTDGTPLTDLAGYRIYIGTTPGNYSSSIDVGNVISYSITNLVPGSYYFSITAYNSSGVESGYSNEGSKTI